MERTRARCEAVHALRAQGESITAIVAQLQLARGTVRRFVRATNVEELIAAPRAGRPSVLDDYKPYLHERWNAGVTNASALYREIVEQGYRGRQVTVAAYLAPFRTLASAPPVAAIVPKVRHVVSWMLRHPDDLDDEQQLHLKQARASCPELDATAAHVSAFAAMLTGRHGERLESWMAAVEADNLPHLHRFVTGLRRDHAAVLNGLTLAYSSGAVEGKVNRYVHPAAPPFHIAHGEADRFVPAAQSRQLVESLRAAGVPVEFTQVPGADHLWMHAPDPEALFDAAVDFARRITTQHSVRERTSARAWRAGSLG